MPPKVQALTRTIQATLYDEFVKWAARMVIWLTGAAIVALLTPLGGQIVAVWRAPEAIASVQATQEVIASNLMDLRAEIRAASGEDRVIRQPAGQSYILEPVHEGENVVMILTVERTTFGRDCRLTDWTPLFTDERNVAIPGDRPAPVRRQVSDGLVRLRVEMIPPDVLIPGRVEVYLALQYDCAGEVVLESTSVVPYTLLPRGG